VGAQVFGIGQRELAVGRSFAQIGQVDDGDAREADAIAEVIEVEMGGDECDRSIREGFRNRPDVAYARATTMRRSAMPPITATTSTSKTICRRFTVTPGRIRGGWNSRSSVLILGQSLTTLCFFLTVNLNQIN